MKEEKYLDEKVLSTRIVGITGIHMKPNPHINPDRKRGRNDYCHCGSYIKYKKCCWKIDKGL